jgi:hypothetical protein
MLGATTDYMKSGVFCDVVKRTLKRVWERYGLLARFHIRVGLLGGLRLSAGLFSSALTFLPEMDGRT